MSIERDLHDLLYAHDCVIVPQWGGFLTHYRPARLDEARKLVHPPAKDLSFNRHLVRNDGLLADKLAKHEGITFDLASNRIDVEVTSWREALDRSGRLELPQVGIFYRDAEHNLQFDPDKRANYLKDAFGLRPLAAVPVERVKAAPVVIPMPVAPPELEHEDRRRPLWWAAAVAALIFGGAAVWAYQMGNKDGTRWSGITLFRPSPPPSYTALARAAVVPVEVPVPFELPEGEGVRTVPLSINDSVRLIVDLGRSVAPAIADTTAVATRPVIAVASDERFHVVGGCFALPENADKKLNELKSKGYPARQLAIRGRLHPVVYGSYATRNEALAAMAAIRQRDGAAAWLLVR